MLTATLMFAALLTSSEDAGKDLRASLKWNAFSISEIRHPKDTKDLKILYNGKEIKIGQVILTKDVDIEVVMKWKHNGVNHKATMELELWDDGTITEFDFQIIPLPDPKKDI